MSKDISPEVADKMMVKCGRRCCICRRFRPTKLQVHHIIERSKGGSNDENNLIVTCLSCHSDVHTHVPFARRFTVEELKGHRDTVIKMVSEGLLPTRDEDDTDTLLATIAGNLRVTPDAEIPLMPEAVELLLTAVNGKQHSQGRVSQSSTLQDFSVEAGGKVLVKTDDMRTKAIYLGAIEQLFSAGLIEGQGHKNQTFRVTYEGYLLADEVMSRSGQEGR